MTLTQIFIFAALGLAAGRFYKRVSRSWLLFIASVLATFWLQPASAIRNLAFVLPTLSLGLAVLIWAITAPRENRFLLQDKLAAAALMAIALFLSATRYVDPLCCLTAARPPQIELVALLVIALAAIGLLAYRFLRGQTFALHSFTVFLLLILAILKSEPLAQGVSVFLRNLTGQDPSLASSLDFGWLGFSYISFRLVHVLRDRVAGRLSSIGLRDFVTYIVFFPALTAGPIERVERFVPQLAPQFVLEWGALLAAGKRLLAGLFMKFVLADALAFFALNPVNVYQVNSTAWSWVLLVAYSFRIFFDFAGYTHIAIGLGLLFGVPLPENFDRPYLKSNITGFWNSWHMTLANWFRAYYFNPVTRYLRYRNLPVALIIAFGQLTTMALIGLWHGITWNFLIWGLWHGVGLFVHNQWQQFAKTRQLIKHARLSQGLGALTTFAFVTLGWVWFALPEPDDAARVLRILFAVGG
ncbi:MAG: MBOAT family O-acyltransferase [Anaerolineales bacterium]